MRQPASPRTDTPQLARENLWNALRKGLAGRRGWKHSRMPSKNSTRAFLGWAFVPAFVLAVALGFGIGAAYAAVGSAPAPHTMLARFATDLDIRTARPGQAVSLEIVPPFPTGSVSYEGASVRGHVVGLLPPSSGRTARLALAFDEILLPNGAVAPIAGHAHAHPGASTPVDNILGKWVGLTHGGERSEYIVQRGSTVRVHVDQTGPRPPQP